MATQAEERTLDIESSILFINFYENMQKLYASARADQLVHIKSIDFVVDKIKEKLRRANEVTEYEPDPDLQYDMYVEGKEDHI